MSKFGTKISDKTMFELTDPGQALDYIKSVVDQYFGEFWSQHKPKCPLCNSQLSDCEKHMNRPVGECTNPKCDSTIHIADYFGKIQDVLTEWEHVKDKWLEKIADKLKQKSTSNTTPAYQQSGGYGAARHQAATGHSQPSIELEEIDEDTVFMW